MTASSGTISGEFAGRYTVERELGRGATAIVYLARDLDYGRHVAIKVLRQEFAESVAADRFLREIRLTAQLHHPHIVPVLGSGESNGRLYFVLPYMDGGTLRDRLKAEKQLPIEDVVAIGSTIAAALGSAHERGMLHRDVKPENILFTGGQACLADFGIARTIQQASGEHSTSTGLVRGTPAYMSPEQAAGDHDYDGRSDIYSLACVLYEALAGVPVFVGATPQAVVAQRLSYEPRPVRMYRSSATPELEAVLAKALATSPADRYQTATEFAAALAQPALAQPMLGASSGSTYRRLTRRPIAALAAGGVIIAALTFAVVNRDSILVRLGEAAALDTLRVVVLPFDSVDRGGVPADGMLREAMRRWKGPTIVESFEVGDAIRRFGYPTGTEDARSLARRLGAGRFVRGSARANGPGLHVDATLFDTRTGSPLYAVSGEVGPSAAPNRAEFAAMADSLALRGAHADFARDVADPVQSLPATQSMISAGTAMAEWDLPRAESLFVRALEYEPASARAAFWIAQLRAWRGQPRDSWRDLAARAARDSSGLTATERSLSQALDALGAGQAERACESYASIAKRNPRDFAAWFGRGQCIEFDNVVIADSRAASGWRFRSSYQQAINAYVRAFELLPSVYKNYQGNAYAQLARLLYVYPREKRFGRGQDESKRYLGSLVASGDTVAFAVAPLEVVAAARAADDPAATAAGIAQVRTLFQRITRTWASAFPRSAGAKEGLALSLELRGDASAIDTLRAALRMSVEAQQRARLLGNLIWAETKFGIAGRPELLRDARRLADSVVRTAGAGSADRSTFELQGRLAALTGHCSAAIDFAHRAAAPSLQRTPIPDRVVADAQARLVNAAMGCGDLSLPSIDQLVAGASLDRAPESMRLIMIQSVFLREIRSAEVLDTAWAVRLARSGDYLLTARVAAERGMRDSARAVLERIRGLRRYTARISVSPDAAVPETFAWLRMRDSTAALRWLDDALSEAAFFPPMFGTESDNIVMTAFTVRALVLRADVARDARDRRRWATSALALWDGADAALAPTVARLRQYMRP